MKARPPVYNLMFLVSAVLTALIAMSCVRSKVIVTTEPEGAVVTMNGVHLGETPLEHPFTWYWYYDFVAFKEGYETTKVRKRFYAPPYLWPGFDLVMEAMPFWVKDTKRVNMVLEPIDERPAPIFEIGPEAPAETRETSYLIPSGE